MLVQRLVERQRAKTGVRIERRALLEAFGREMSIPMPSAPCATSVASKRAGPDGRQRGRVWLERELPARDVAFASLAA
jgi:hypothetical protein